jgi:hypothetical protein
MSCAQVAYQYEQSHYPAEGSYQLEAALAAALQREQALVQMVEQQRAEIDHLRSTINAMQLTEALRSLDFGSPVPSAHATPQHSFVPCTPPRPSAMVYEASLALGMDSLQMEES